MNKVDVIELMNQLEEIEVPYLVQFKGVHEYELCVATYPGVRLSDEKAKVVADILDEMKLTCEVSPFGVRVL